jgi:hypothetical protein
MQYPKPIMSVTELTELGFTRNYLYQMSRRKGQKYCTKVSNNGKSKLIFDTDKFEKERQLMLTR